MSESLLQKFPGLGYADIRVFPYEARFSAALAAGKYTFGSATTYDTFNMFEAIPGKYYYLDNVSISSNLNEADFMDAVDISFNPVGFALDFYQSQQKSVVTLKPFTFSGLRQNLIANIVINTKRGNSINSMTEVIQARLNGQLDQTPAITLLGVDPIVVLVQTTVYEISNIPFIRKYFESAK